VLSHLLCILQHLSGDLGDQGLGPVSQPLGMGSQPLQSLHEELRVDMSGVQVSALQVVTYRPDAAAFTIVSDAWCYSLCASLSCDVLQVPCFCMEVDASSSHSDSQGVPSMGMDALQGMTLDDRAGSGWLQQQQPQQQYGRLSQAGRSLQQALSAQGSMSPQPSLQSQLGAQHGAVGPKPPLSGGPKHGASRLAGGSPPGAAAAAFAAVIASEAAAAAPTTEALAAMSCGVPAPASEGTMSGDPCA